MRTEGYYGSESLMRNGGEQMLLGDDIAAVVNVLHVTTAGVAD
jgi:hypothetical protein